MTFQKVNDTYGHTAGDEVLVSVAQIMKKNMAGKGFAARWGGEEFLLVYTGCDMETTLAYLEILTEAIREMYVEYDDKTIRITMSIGVATGMVILLIKYYVQQMTDYTTQKRGT